MASRMLTLAKIVELGRTAEREQLVRKLSFKIYLRGVKGIPKEHWEEVAIFAWKQAELLVAGRGDPSLFDAVADRRTT